MPAEVHTLWQPVEDGVATLVLAHGAGAGMDHAHMRALAEAFARFGLATLRFNFPFIDEGRKRVDSAAVATQCIAEAFVLAGRLAASPVWLGGHSFGGRMASHALLEHGLDARGLIFCSFPLHPAGRPAVDRARHLARIDRPMLFLSGTRDALAVSELLAPVVAALPTAELHWLATADHGYRVQVRRRQGAESVYDEAARAAREFVLAHDD
jgi:uncharacterized protein